VRPTHKFWLLLGFVLAIQTTSSNQSFADARSCADGGICVVGDTGPGGGKIFFVKSTGAFSKSRIVPGFFGSTTYTVSLSAAEQAALPFDYLEVAPTQRTLGFWGSNGAVTGDTSELIGTGSANTTKIIATFTSDNASNNAAIYADQYTNAGKTDWYLPSYEELLLIMILSLESDSGGPSIGTFSQGLWSSSSMDPTSARYSARGQLSGYVTRGTNSGGVAAIRAISYTAPSPSSGSDDEAARKQAEEARAARVRAARIDLQQRLESEALITEQNLVEADVPLKRPENLVLAYQELIAFQKTLLAPLSELEKNQKKYSVIMKYVTVEKITGQNSSNLFARNLVSFGLLDAATPQKTRIISALMRQPLDNRDSMEKVNRFIAQEVKLVENRKARLAFRLAKSS
jgi:hypothetical protein